MRGVALLAASLALASTAHAGSRAFVVDDVKRWQTPEAFAPEAHIRIRVFIRRREADTAYSDSRSAGWALAGVVVEAASPRKRGAIRFRMANARRRDALVRLVYYEARRK